jgi:Ca2+-binding RTX toxin-like protein
VENITLTGTLLLAATGNSGANRIDGAQNTAFNTLAGSGGNDTYIVGFGDTVVEAAGGGTDTVLVAASYALPAGAEVEVIQAQPGAPGLSITGNAVAQTLIGGAGPDLLVGNGGGDILVGNAGFDVLQGAAGFADTMRFLLPGDSVVGTQRDVVQAFNPAEGDRIDLAAIDANPGLAGDQGFTFRGTDAFTGAGAELRFFVSGSSSVIQAAISGSTVAFEIRVSGLTSLGAGDFLL